MRVNLGCGQSPTAGWTNLDNSLTVRLASTPLARLLRGRASFIDIAKKHDIKYGGATQIPLPGNSVDVLYSSHMLEHLDREEASMFLREAFRVMKPGATLRLAVPNLRYHVTNYINSGDADKFMEGIFTSESKPKSLVAKLRYAFFTGFRQHHWMYDERSLLRLVQRSGFKSAVVLQAGTTTIDDPGALDLSEREGESLYVEAMK